MLAALLLIGGAGRVGAQEPGTNLQVYLLTMGPGAEIYERFGHNAIWIRDTAARTNLVYNFGMFSFGNGSATDLIKFGINFAKGPQRYWLGVDSSLDNELLLYREHRRDLDAQELNFTPAQRADIAARLATNALEANRYYAYDYFRDNCSTRVRDILDLELGGALKRVAAGKAADGTLRFHTRRSITNDKLLFIGIDIAFGPRVDRPLDQWDEMFLPAKVAERVTEVTVTGPDGQPVPLVKRKFSLLTIGEYHVEPRPPSWTGPFLLIGLVVTGLIRLSRSTRPVAIVGRLVGGAWMLVMGIGGIVLLAFWIVTRHVATHGNFNLLLVSPLALALVPAFWHRAARQPGGWTPRIAMAVMVSVGVGAALALFPGVTGQDNTLAAALVALPTFSGALEALASWNRRRANPEP